VRWVVGRLCGSMLQPGGLDCQDRLRITVSAAILVNHSCAGIHLPANADTVRFYWSVISTH
jgi:hypothetical protein